ncbi:LuxR C-terminal-related transcriptional regulator [Cellulomonas sp. P5_C5]
MTYDIGSEQARPVRLTSGSGVIRAKLAPPRLPRGVVGRRELLDVLQGGRGRRLTLVSAPAGFGKTTLLAQWAQAEEPEPARRFAWVSLDAGDCEPERFWTHVAAALCGVEPGVTEATVAAMRARPQRIGDVGLPLLYEALADGAEDTVLVLDDYHRAETPEISALLAEFMRYRPERVQLVVSTRSDPALGVARLRASGDLVEVRADALRFDEAEVASFFDGIGLAGLTPTEGHQLVERTGGWPAPLRLASLLMPEDGRATFIAQFSGASRHVVDYLAQDVLDLVDPATRDFLLQVSILGRFTGSLCDAVTATTGSGALLADLERANLFISVDSEGEWYHPHQLFTEALRVELTRTRPALVPVLHARAAGWLEAAGDIEAATDHAVAARDVHLASRLVAGQVQPMSASGRGANVRRWLAALSWPEALRDPELAFVRAVTASLANQLDEATQWLDVARTGDLDARDAAGLPLGFRVDFLDSVMGVNDVGHAREAAQRAVVAAPSLAWHGVALGCLGQALYLAGQHGEATAALRVAVGEISDAHPIMLAFAVGNLALVESSTGAGSHADPLLDRLTDVLRAIGADRSVPAALLLLARGERARRLGDPQGALVELRCAIDVLEDMPRSAWLANAFLLLAATERLVGHAQGALEAVDRAQEILDRLPDPGALLVRAASLRAALSAPVRHATEFGEALSEREVVVLRLAADGLQQREIADQLFISYNTVKSHLKAAYRKLGVTSREAAIERLQQLDGTPAQH